METEITAFDFERMFLGDLPWAFTLEVVFRTAFMFVYTVGLVRVLGKRGMRQLSPYEIVIIIALGSAVGDPMFYADVPLVHAVIVVSVVVLLVRTLAIAGERWDRVEHAIESDPTLLIRNGVIDVKALDHERLAHDELLADLREAGIENLADVRLAYLEASGNLSVFRAPEDGAPLAGLSTFPEDAEAPLDIPRSNAFVCRRCARLLGAADSPCPVCRERGKVIPAALRGGVASARP